MINASLKQFQDAQARSRRGAGPAIFGDGNDGDPHGKTLGDWLVQVAILGSPKTSLQAKAAAQDRIEKVYSSEYNAWQKAAMAESSGTTGGYAVSPDFYQQQLAIASEESTFRQFGFVQPMASATLQFPFLDITTAQAAGNSPLLRRRHRQLDRRGPDPHRDRNERYQSGKCRR